LLLAILFGGSRLVSLLSVNLLTLHFILTPLLIGVPIVAVAVAQQSLSLTQNVVALGVGRRTGQEWHCNQ
jgi:hypothetical protein